MNLINNYQSQRVRDAVLQINNIKKNDILAHITVLLPFQNLSRTIEKELVKQKLSYVNLSFITLPILIKTETQLYKYINNLSSIAFDEKRNLFTSIIKSNKLSYFEKILDFNSVPMLFMQTVNEFRLETIDDTSKQGLEKFADKGKDLLKIINSYELHLKKNNLIDYADECKIFISEIEFNKNHTYISLLSNDFEYSYLEKECLSILKKNTNFIEIKSKPDSKYRRKINLKSAPFETLEVKDIFRDIFKICKFKNASFNDFCIVCPTEDYVEIIKSYSDLSDIPCEFDTGIFPTQKRGFELFNSIVSLFQNDFQFVDFKHFLQLFKNENNESNINNKNTGNTESSENNQTPKINKDTGNSESSRSSDGGGSNRSSENNQTPKIIGDTENCVSSVSSVGGGSNRSSENNQTPKINKKTENSVNNISNKNSENKYSKSQLLKISRKVLASESLEKNIRLVKEKIDEQTNCLNENNATSFENDQLNLLKILLKILKKFYIISQKYYETAVISHHISFLKSIVNEYINFTYEKSILLKCIDSLDSSTFEMNNIKFDLIYDKLKKEINSVRMYPPSPKSSVFITCSKNIPSFDYVFTIGLNDEHYPKRSFQNPILLDDEKKILNEKFNMNFTLTDDKNNFYDIIFENMVSSSNIEWTGYFSTMDTMSGKERIPSFYFIPVYEAMPRINKITTASKKDEWAEFIKKLKNDKDMISKDTENALTQFEYDFGKMRVQKKRYFKHLINNNSNNNNNNIMRTYKSEISKWKLNFNEYTGIINEIPIADEFKSSPTALESFMSCPYAYWLQRELKIKPIEDPEKSDSLDAITMGNICHETLAEFMSNNKDKSISESDIHNLLEIAENKLKKSFEMFDLKYEINEIKNTEEIKKIMKMFIEFEMKNHSEPLWFEKEFGKEEKNQKRIDVDTGKNIIKLSGSIDRIDKIEDGYKIIDYKTSTNNKFVKEEVVFYGGTMLQPYLYAEVLKKLNGFQNKKILTGYLPLKTKNDKPLKEKIIEYNESIKKQLFEIIDYLSELRKNGIYFQSGNCEYCLYQDVCGAMVQLQTKKKFENSKSDFVKKYLKLSQLS